MFFPTIIQGGMGIGVSNWVLARAVSLLGQLGVVSGVVLDVLFSRRLQDGDPGGHMRRALDHFPFPDMAERVYRNYFVPGGKSADSPYKSAPMYTLKPRKELLELGIVAGFCEVWLAKRGHNNPVGINLMQKLDMSNLAILYGAMLAGVDCLIEGAGIPSQVPGILEGLAKGEPVFLRIEVHGASNGDGIYFDPSRSGPIRQLKKPLFFPIVGSYVLAARLAKIKEDGVNGLIVVRPIAAGHSAPPRGDLVLVNGEPVYGPKDEANLDKIKGLNIPFWLAGGYGYPEKLKEALGLGATGIQIGTPFAMCAEAGFTDEIKSQVINLALSGDLRSFMDPYASPTGFPFKLAQLPGTLSETSVYEKRPRICDLGYLRQLFMGQDGKIISRCPAEPEGVYVQKGGKTEDVIGRRCLCNALLANVGHPQVRKDGYVEPTAVTIGKELEVIRTLVQTYGPEYTAANVVAYMLGG